MCGIVGYIGRGSAAGIGMAGLKRLEYRGYDSAGIAIAVDGRLEIRKDAGRIGEIDRRLGISKMDGSLAILHTRWSTHGEPSKANAHPHADCTGDIAVVHNGIIENHSSLRELLSKEGHVFRSQTDSEVIAHLVEKFYSGSLEGAVAKALQSVEGAYGIAVVHKNERKIVAARNGSSLLIGVGRGEMMVASDAAAVLERTKRVIYLNDNEMAVVTDSGAVTKNLRNEQIEKHVEEITWNLERIEKKGFRHFMMKEIFEQPESLENAMRGRIGPCEPEGLAVKLSLDIDVGKAERIIIAACGTSWHAGLAGKWLIEGMARVPVEVDYASEFRYRKPLIGKKDLFIAISQSGETADTLAALREARKAGAMTLGIVNVVGSTIAREAGCGIYTHAGPEIGVASTKAFTSQISALCMLALFLRHARGMELDMGIISELKSMPEKVRQALAGNDGIRKIAERFAKSTNFLYLGRGVNFPVALEGALKLKEISYIHAEGYPAAEMKHGPIALIDKDMPVVFIATRGNSYEKILNNMEEVKARKGVIIAVVTVIDSDIERLADHVIKVPETAEMLTPIVNVIPLQLLAYHIADIKGLDPDKPRNLAKSVTVE